MGATSGRGEFHDRESGTLEPAHELATSGGFPRTSKERPSEHRLCGPSPPATNGPHHSDEGGRSEAHSVREQFAELEEPLRAGTSQQSVQPIARGIDPLEQTGVAEQPGGGERSAEQPQEEAAREREVPHSPERRQSAPSTELEAASSYDSSDPAETPATEQVR